jgi:type I restriction enzyme S subunit
MADLTSLHRNKPKRDFSIQACADCINKIALEFPNEFQEGFFTDYFDIAGGTQPPKSTFLNEPREGYVKFLQIRDFSSDSSPTYIPISKNNKLCNEEDLVLGRYGASVGKILTGKSGAYNVACAKIIFLKKEVIDKDFLFYWLHSTYFQYFLTSISRSAQGGFNKNDLSRIRTLFPSIQIQRKLASILKSIDLALVGNNEIEFDKTSKSEIEIAFIDLSKKFLSIIKDGESLTNELTHQLSLVKKLRQQLLQDAVQGKLVPQDKNEEPASELLKKIKAEKTKDKKYKEIPAIKPEEIPFDIPDNWVWCKMGDLAIHSEAGKSYQAIEIQAQENEWGVIKTSAITSGVFLENENKKLPIQADYGNIEIALGDIIFCRASGSKSLAGKSCLVDYKPKARLILSDKSVRFIFPEMLSKKFIHAFTSSRFAETYYQSLGTGKSTSMNNITRDQFNNLLMPLPPDAEQHRIVAKLEELMQNCDELEASIYASKGQNEQLLQQVLREALKG